MHFGVLYVCRRKVVWVTVLCSISLVIPFLHSFVIQQSRYTGTIYRQLSSYICMMKYTARYVGVEKKQLLYSYTTCVVEKDRTESTARASSPRDSEGEEPHRIQFHFVGYHLPPPEDRNHTSITHSNHILPALGPPDLPNGFPLWDVLDAVRLNQAKGVVNLVFLSSLP